MEKIPLMKRLAILLPWFSFFLREQYTKGFICLALQISVVGWPIASLWAFITVITSGKAAREGFVMDSLRPYYHKGQQLQNKRIA
jgi:hypothetical protein